ncbi:unnamed protein product [Orchesella dallaii]|uniref:Mitochondrial chaperone BCS1 n=1 Tax=Orchesella dallaii TaxID=48710 RepID=A0ABP1Q175_9HEXA
MSKVYPRHGAGGGAGGGERIRQTYQAPRAKPQAQQQYRSRPAGGGGGGAGTGGDDDYWPSLFTILCSIPVIFLVYHYTCKLLSKIIWGSLPISVEVSGPRSDQNLAPEECLYHWLLEWLSKNTRNLQNSTVRLRPERNDRGRVRMRLVRYPGFGTTNFYYHGTNIKMERMMIGSSEGKGGYEKIIMSFVSSRRNRTLLYELLEECKPKLAIKSGDSSDDEQERRVNIFGLVTSTQNGNPYWRMIGGGGGRKKRPITTVILPEVARDRLEMDVREFLKEAKWYLEKGIPYRRTYLLHGPSGCGKSSLVRAIAGDFSYDICTLSLASKSLTDETLNVLLNEAPENSILLLEDLEEAVLKALSSSSSPSLTLGGLLNCLDGVGSTEGRIIFIITNSIDKLPPALIRPGRVDMKLHLDYPDDDQLKQVYARFYPEAGIRMKAEFVKRVRELRINVTMAQIQGLFMFYKKDGQDVIDNVMEYFQDQFLVTELEPQ